MTNFYQLTFPTTDFQNFETLKFLKFEWKFQEKLLKSSFTKLWCQIFDPISRYCNLLEMIGKMIGVSLNVLENPKPNNSKISLRPNIFYFFANRERKSGNLIGELFSIIKNHKDCDTIFTLNLIYSSFRYGIFFFYFKIK